MTTVTNKSNPNSNSMPLEPLNLLMLAAMITASLLLMLHKGMVILHTLSRVAGSKLMITLVIRPKGCLTRSSLDMISRTMGHLAMGHQLLTQLRMVVLHRAMVVQAALVKHLQGSKLQLQPLEANRVILINHLYCCCCIKLHGARFCPLNLDTLLHTA
ncbi:hypothetical protein ACQJBY_051148 [Aegilops geniculata]